jgi:hypothetical protein
MRGWARDWARGRHSAGKCGDRGKKLMVANDVSSDSDSHASLFGGSAVCGCNAAGLANTPGCCWSGST